MKSDTQKVLTAQMKSVTDALLEAEIDASMARHPAGSKLEKEKKS